MVLLGWRRRFWWEDPTAADGRLFLWRGRRVLIHQSATRQCGTNQSCACVAINGPTCEYMSCSYTHTAATRASNLTVFTQIWPRADIYKVTPRWVLYNWVEISCFSKTNSASLLWWGAARSIVNNRWDKCFYWAVVRPVAHSRGWNDAALSLL